MKHSHYKKDVSHLSFIDPYRIADLYGIGGGPLEHAHKKILCCGIRGAKNSAQDIQEAIDSLVRWQEMQREDAAAKLGDFGQQNMLAPADWPDENGPKQQLVGQGGELGKPVYDVIYPQPQPFKCGGCFQVMEYDAYLSHKCPAAR